MKKKNIMFMKNKKGMTLVEVMLALVVFLVGSLGILAMHGVTVIGNDFSENARVARALAMSQIDFLRRLPVANPELADCGAWDDNNPSFCHVDGGDTEGVFPADGGAPTYQTLNGEGKVSSNGRFTRRWHVEQQGGGTLPTTRTIHMEVTWTDLGIETSSGPTPRAVRYITRLVQP